MWNFSRNFVKMFFFYVVTRYIKSYVFNFLHAIQPNW